MNKDQFDYEESLRKKLYDFEMEPSDKVWEGIGKNINTDDSAIRGWAASSGRNYWTLAVGGIALILIIYSAFIKLSDKGIFNKSTNPTIRKTTHVGETDSKTELLKNTPGTYYYRNNDSPIASYTKSTEVGLDSEEHNDSAREGFVDDNGFKITSGDKLIENKKNNTTKGNTSKEAMIIASSSSEKRNNKTIINSTEGLVNDTSRSSHNNVSGSSKSSKTKHYSTKDKRSIYAKDPSLSKNTSNKNDISVTDKNGRKSKSNYASRNKSNTFGLAHDREQNETSSYKESFGQAGKKPLELDNTDKAINDQRKGAKKLLSNGNGKSSLTTHPDKISSNILSRSPKEDNEAISNSKEGIEKPQRNNENINPDDPESNVLLKKEVLVDSSLDGKGNAPVKTFVPLETSRSSTETIVDTIARDTASGNIKQDEVSVANKTKDTSSQNSGKTDEVNAKNKGTTKEILKLKTSLDLFVSPEMSYRSIALANSSLEAQKDLAFRKEHEHPRTGIAFGSTINFHLSDNIAIRTGIIYSHFGEKIDYNYETRKSSIDSIETLRIDSTLARDTFGLPFYNYDTLRFYDTKEKVEIIKGNYNFKTSYNFINIPIGLSFTFRPQKLLSFHLSGCVNMSVFLGGSGLVKLDSSTYELRKFKASDSPFRPFGISLLLNPTASYAINERIRINLGPVARHFLTSIYRKEDLFDFKPYSVGLQGGVQIKF